MHHGFNASRTTGFAIADTAGRAGFAVLAIDAFQHGERAASATDQKHAMRGNLGGADGFAETTTFDVSARTFGLLGAPADLTLFPGYPLGAFEQFAADALSAIHLVRTGDPSALQAADPVLAGLAFDSARIAFVGNSMGAVVGTAVVNVEPDIDAAVLNVLPGSIMETLAESGEFRALMESVLLPQLGVSTDFDELERAMLFDPTVDLYRWVLEPVDPLALARTLTRERVAGPPPHLLVQLAGHDEVAAPPASESVIAAAGIAGVGQFVFADVEPVELPLPAAGAEPGAATIAAVRFEDAMHGMLEVASQASHYEDPLVPPLQPREAPTDLANPIVAVHAQLEAFLLGFRTTGQAAIEG
jgi:NAD(P)-dependent dehydrogenase (short-subunit alcohol dehydrogenase family)